MTIAVFSHATCARHQAGVAHPERPERLAAVARGVRAAGVVLEHVDAPAAERAQVTRVHTAALVDAIEQHAPEQGLVQIDADTAMGAASLEAAYRAAGACVAAVDRVLSTAQRAAFCGVRPPGHHAERGRAMGFCLFNNVAIAARHALECHQLERVAIVDFDVHHGNGTEDAVAGDPRVLFCSSFQEGIYPGTPPPPAANVVHTPLPAGTATAGFRRALETSWWPRLEQFDPQLLLISAGFDAHARDPLAGLALQAEDYEWVTRRLLEVVGDATGGRVVSTLEGGYDLQALEESAAAHVAGLAG